VQREAMHRRAGTSLNDHPRNAKPRQRCRGFCLQALIFRAIPQQHPVIPGRRVAPSPESIGPQLMAYYVHLLASDKYGTLYLGVTNDIVRRVYEHKTKAVAGFTKRYDVDRLVWFEIYDDPTSAITREKELKKWRRAWKIRLIEERNPQRIDLYPQISA
jgi:putative endonuclease